MKRFLVIAALLAATASPAVVQAQPQARQYAQAERQAPQYAQAERQVPLSRVLEMIAKQIPGRHLNTTMGDAGGRPAYFVQWQTPDGRVQVIVVDAQSGQIIGRQ